MFIFKLLLIYFFSSLGRSETEATRYVGHYWPTVAAPDDDEWQGKPVPEPISPPQIPYGLT
jgi:hypothetical protein